MAKSVLIKFLYAYMFIMAATAGFAEEAVNIKILAVNPSKDNNLKTEVVHTLPAEIKPEDILDQAGMEIHYDGEKKAYILVSQLELLPRETKTLIVKVKNVWVIPDEEISAMRSKFDVELKSLEGTKYFETAKLLHAKAVERISQIEEEQSQAIGVRQQIELYRAHVKQISELQKGLLSLDEIQKKELGIDTEQRTVIFSVSAQNPSDAPRSMNVRAELPKDVQSEDILDKLDFTMLFDEEKSRFILQKTDEFAPKETKNFRIVLKDIWYILPEEIKTIRDQIVRITELFAGSDYESYAKPAVEYITVALDEIDAAQEQLSAETPLNERMRIFVLNSQKFRLVKKKMQELQDLILRLPLKSMAKDDSLFTKLFRGVKEVQKVADVSKLLSMGVDPTVSTTWWIIIGIMFFLAILAIVFYFTWLGKLNQDVYAKKKNPGEKKA